METDKLGQLIRALGRLYDYSQKMGMLRTIKVSSYKHDLVAPIRQRLENPLDLALAEICHKYGKVLYKARDEMTGFHSSSRNSKTLLTPYSVLAAHIDRQVFIELAAYRQL